MNENKIWNTTVETFVPRVLSDADLEKHCVYVLDMNKMVAHPTVKNPDIWRMVSSLQGVFNRDFKTHDSAIYLLFQDEYNDDAFWLDYMMCENRFLSGYKKITLETLEAFLDVFEPVLRDAGISLWDRNVPATSNVAATACGLYNWIPVLFDEREGSLYRLLMARNIPVHENYVGKFTGVGTIPDINIASTGSAKNDAYYWAAAQYMSKTNPGYLAYYVDGATCMEEHPLYSEWGNAGHLNSLPNHDFYLAKRAFFFDLSPADDELPCDDPGQSLGTDANTYHKILSTAYWRNKGQIIHNGGHVSWRLKYSSYEPMGIHNSIHDNCEIESIWNQFCSRYNVMADCDASHPCWMTNASLYNQFPVLERYPNNNHSNEHIEYDPDTVYLMLYVGDYDGSAWFKGRVRQLWEAEGRGEKPMAWSFDPNLVERCAPMFDFMYSSMTEHDYFISANSGAGQISIGSLMKSTDPKRSLPDGCEAWGQWCGRFFHQFNMDITGLAFDITPPQPQMLDVFSQFSPIGVCHIDPEESMRAIRYKDTPFLFLDAHAASYAERFTLEERVDRIMESLDVNLRLHLNYGIYRTVCYTYPMLVELQEGVLSEAQKRYPNKKFRFVDPYTLYEAVRRNGVYTTVVEPISGDNAPA